MKIGVFGSAEGNTVTDIVKKRAYELGVEAARRGHEIITGASTGLPYEAILGAASEGGVTLGFSPARNAEEHTKFGFPSEGFGHINFIPADFPYLGGKRICQKYRNVLAVAASDCAIFIGGRMGTMNEFTLAFDFGKCIGLMEGTGGIVDRTTHPS